ncbi:hypothetical protein Btru_057486 [Bulinus truncatus]|nr:hypothetical protein Btru_057486 [Bulinus truncatus]
MQTTRIRFNLIGIFLVILAFGRSNSEEEEEVCDVEQGDIIFVMDASSSIGPKYWQVQTSFVANVTKHFTVGPNRVRFGALIFYKTAHKIFDLKDHLTNEAVSKAVLEIPYPKSSGTYTHLALQEVIKQDMFGAAAGGKEKAPDIVIVITDGFSIYPKKTSEVANLLKSKNIILLSIGIGSETKQSELEAIASDKSLVFSVRDYDVLQGIQNDLVRIACKPTTVTTTTTTEEPTTTTEEPTTTTEEPTTTTEEPTTTTENPTTTTTQKTTTTAITRPPYPPSTPVPCINTTKADIIFIIDGSTSIGNRKWKNQTQFAASVTQYFSVDPNVRFGAVVFHKYAEKKFDLKDHYDHESLSNAILNISYPNIWGTNTDKALEFVHNESMFGPQAGGREDVPNIALLMTDGMSSNMSKTIAAANALKARDNVTIIAVGIGKEVNKEELSGVASRPELAFYSQDYTLLDYISNELVAVTCETAIREYALSVARLNLDIVEP